MRSGRREASRAPAAGTGAGASAGGRHLAYVLKRFPRISETFIAAELIELERRGEHVTVFALSRPPEPFVHAFVAELRAPVVYLPHRPLREPARVARALWRTLRAERRGWLRAAVHALLPPSLPGVRRLLQATVLREEAAAGGVDHMHAHFATAAASLTYLVHLMDGTSYSVTAHAKDVYHRGVQPDRLRRKLEAARFVTTVSEANRRYLADRLRLDGAVRTIPNSVDLRRFDRRARAPDAGLVVCVARLVEKKGHRDLIEACGLLAGRGIDLRLELIGDGPLRHALERAARRAGAPVRFQGALPHERTIEVYRRAAVFCLPCVVASSGDRDGLPTSVLEAMALGVPVVTTDIPGLDEAVVDGVTGLIVPQRDPPRLADALGRLLTDPRFADRLGRAGRRRVERRFSLARSVSELQSLFPGGRAA